MKPQTRLHSLFDLTERVAVLTGGAGLLGFQMACALSEAGARVVLASREEARCQAAAARLVERGGEAVGMTVDVTDPAACDRLARETIARLGRLDIWVNNAAHVQGCAAPLEQQSPQDWQATVDSCLNSVFYGAQAALRCMQAQERGVIINIASIYGLVSPDPRIYGDSGINSPPQYAAAKAGVVQLTRYLAVHLAPHGIRVNAITPGGFFDDHDPAFLRQYCEHTPLRRMGSETDLMGAIVYLASDASAYVTGHNLVVDGGWTAW
jgi:NAD(P)-dependent dehydrogenase (short-subunit alcohol dehydrogenase family)